MAEIHTSLAMPLLKWDTTSIVWGQWREHKSKRYLVVRVKHWQPPRDLRNPARAQQDYRIPQAELLAHITGLSRRYRVQSVGYDRMFFEPLAQELADRGLVMVDYPQTDVRMSAASILLHDLISEETIAHDGDAMLTAHIKSAVARQTSLDAEKYRMSKRLSKRSIDGAISLAIMSKIASSPEEEAPAAAGDKVAVMLSKVAAIALSIFARVCALSAFVQACALRYDRLDL